jgi:DNA-binding NarL/FixJ family response regulator
VRANKNPKIGIVIADDHVVLLESLSALLETQPDFQVLGKASNGTEALNQVQAFRPRVLVLDLFMPDGDGFEVLRTIERSGNRVASVILTGSDSQTDYVQVVRLGARGLVLKGDPPEKLFSAIRSVASGELAFSDEIAHQVLTAMAQDAHQEATSIGRLSERERQISMLVARGLKNRDIAQELTISENTVKRHLQSIFSKTGARDRLELAVLALTELSRVAA